jgi:hypothetical protein
MKNPEDTKVELDFSDYDDSDGEDGKDKGTSRRKANANGKKKEGVKGRHGGKRKGKER